jgi:hypothetical protein
VGSILGDGIAQYTAARGRSSVVSTQQPAYDVGRVARLCTYAALIGTPIGHYWFNFLDKVSKCGLGVLVQRLQMAPLSRGRSVDRQSVTAWCSTKGPAHATAASSCCTRSSRGAGTPAAGALSSFTARPLH